ncbi:MFS transporter [Paraburkholderia bannensis]|uniref:MFS transporter n=1 Tax=Paraburkholderia bannensis TaxID=765414 RepID=UPI002AB2BD77|nr:MFS transporter [Paraburkholderia bannensis]
MASAVLPKVALSDARIHAANEQAAQIAARVNRLPSCKPLWVLTCYVALAGIFELYDLFQTGYLTPALIRAGVFSKDVHAFGMSDQALFASATFLGLFAGSAFLSPIVDRFGRRKVFMWALIFYSASTAIMSCQDTAMGVIVFRLLAGVGLGVELVTTDAYLTEVLPNSIIGRAFALMHVIFYMAVPLLAFLSWQLMPASPLGIEGWRWVTIVGSFGALLAWILRRGLMESPRWLAVRGRADEAEAVMTAIEASVVKSTKTALPSVDAVTPLTEQTGAFSDIWKRPYLGRTVMLVCLNFFQTIGFYGFTNWLPSLLSSQGQSFTHSYFYSFCIAFAYPISALLWTLTVADRFERKWLIVASALCVTVLGPLFAFAHNNVLTVVLGFCITSCLTLISMSYHPYQAELYPTSVRARAVGFVYSFSRLSTAFTSFLISFFLNGWGSPGVFALISFSMAAVVVSVGVFGQKTQGVTLD